MSLQVKQPYKFRGFDAPKATVMIDWVSFDRCEGRAEIVLGIYRAEEDTEPGQSKTNRLDTVHLVFQNNTPVTEIVDGESVTTIVDQYDELIQKYPELFTGIVAGVYELAASQKPEVFKMEKKK